MKVLLLNLPNSNRVTRRYMCSYYSESSLFPPVELLSLGGVAKKYNQISLHFIDAIAKEYSNEKTLNEINNIQPDYIVSIIGFECFEEDMNTIKYLKKQHKHSSWILFGHYPTLFSNEVLAISGAEMVIKGEPELIFDSLLYQLLSNASLSSIDGLVLSDVIKPYLKQENTRIRKPAELAMPAYELLDINAYEEPMMLRPFAMIQSARGCPYNCNFCVRSYGTRLGLRDPEDVINEIKLLIHNFGIRSLRFIDDTFTVSNTRVKKICQLIVENNIKLSWSCLSRTDNIKEDMLDALKMAGCKRIYFGIESGSQKMLDYYSKGIDKKQALEALKLCRKKGIETVGFFMTGLPNETDEDFEETIQFAIESNLTYAGIAMITPYPGTPLFDQLRNDIDFNLFPYEISFKDKNLYSKYKIREKDFYKRFYGRVSYFKQNSLFFLKSFPEFIQQANSGLKRIAKGRFHLVPKLNYQTAKSKKIHI